MAEGKEEGVGGEPPKRAKRMSGKKLVLFFILPILLVLGGGAAAYVLLFLEDASSEEHAGEGGEDEHAEEALPSIYVEMGQMKQNLITTGKKQAWLVAQLVLEVKTPEDQLAVEQVLPRIENDFNTYFRSLRVEDVEGAGGVDRMRRELLLRARAAVKTAAQPGNVKDVLFKEIVVQQ